MMKMLDSDNHNHILFLREIRSKSITDSIKPRLFVFLTRKILTTVLKFYELNLCRSFILFGTGPSKSIGDHLVSLF